MGAKPEMTTQTFHRCFLSPFGIDDDLDIVDQSLTVRCLKQQDVRRAPTVVILADSTKLGRAASTNVKPLREVDILTTESGLSSGFQQRLRRHRCNAHDGSEEREHLSILEKDGRLCCNSVLTQ